jgi:glycosyltransferase involved in cell wall biosynthesis
MAEVVFSVVIPYRQRLRNVRVALAALADQSFGGGFEVVVGALEYCGEFVAACRGLAGRLSVVSVLVDGEWNTSRARNIAIRQASGRVVVFLDADMVVPPTFLQNLYERYYAHGQNVCVVGQMVGYDGVARRDIDVAEVVSYRRCREILAGLEAGAGAPVEDKRWKPEYRQVVRRFPWAMVRTALVAVPRTLIEEHDLMFDEGFRGWGAEDQEWAFRVSRTGTPLLFQPDVYGLHLPHTRNINANGVAAWANNRYYVRKWPRLDLELALAFGWLQAAEVYPEVQRELAEVAGGNGYTLGVVRGTAGGRDILLIGATLDAQSKVTGAEVEASFDRWSPREVYPLAGFGLPYEDRSVAECRILPPVMRLSERYREAILREAERVADKLVTPVDGHRR